MAVGARSSSLMTIALHRTNEGLEAFLIKKNIQQGQNRKFKELVMVALERKN